MKAQISGSLKRTNLSGPLVASAGDFIKSPSSEKRPNDCQNHAGPTLAQNDGTHQGKLPT